MFPEIVLETLIKTSLYARFKFELCLCCDFTKYMCPIDQLSACKCCALNMARLVEQEYSNLGSKISRIFVELVTVGVPFQDLLLGGIF